MRKERILMQVLVVFAAVAVSSMPLGCVHRSPGTLHASSEAPLTAEQEKLKEELVRGVRVLATEIGPRNAAYAPRQAYQAQQWLLGEVAKAGLEANRVEVKMGEARIANIEVVFPGDERADEILVIGAHYDTVHKSPGANDNASGVSMLLAAVRRLGAADLDRTVRIVFFPNEEYPFSTGIQMGSKVYAKHCRAREDNIVAMIGVDSVGYFSNEPRSQRYPILALNLPKKGNFITFGSNMEHAPLLDTIVSVFQSQSKFPSIGAASDSPHASRGDHAPFWWSGYPAIAMSDTSEYRDPHYHAPTDRAENLNYGEMARLAEGFIATIVELADADTELPGLK
ncbi:MAG: M20/M25/M40 family metallo-hydrolase [Planctomycetota bacterium]